jgi:hypothetical protein
MSDTSCIVEGCARERYARQPWCEPHYRRRLRTGDVDAQRPIGATQPQACLVEGCTRTSTERGLCHGHYLRLIRRGDVLADRPIGRRVNEICTVDGCENAARGRGLCGTHLTRLRVHGDVQEETAVKQSAGAGYVHHGYRVVPVPVADRHLVYGKTAELEHRYVMAKMLGRPMTSAESVHHRSGDRLDNRPENLELWSRWQPSGQRVADKILAAVELLETYAPELLAADTVN